MTEVLRAVIHSQHELEVFQPMNMDSVRIRYERVCMLTADSDSDRFWWLVYVVLLWCFRYFYGAKCLALFGDVAEEVYTFEWLVCVSIYDWCWLNKLKTTSAQHNVTIRCWIDMMKRTLINIWNNNVCDEAHGHTDKYAFLLYFKGRLMRLINKKNFDLFPFFNN